MLALQIPSLIFSLRGLSGFLPTAAFNFARAHVVFGTCLRLDCSVIGVAGFLIGTDDCSFVECSFSFAFGELIAKLTWIPG